MKHHSAIILWLGLVLVSCGTTVRNPTDVLGPADQRMFLSDQPDRADKVDRWISAQSPRIHSPGGTVEAEAALADLRGLFAEVERIHPAYWFAFGSPEAEARWKGHAERWLDHLTADGKVAKADLALVLSYAAAGFEDGHTGLQLRWNSAHVIEDEAVYPPWALEWTGDRWTIDGDEVVGLNGRGISETLEPVLLCISGETPAWRSHLASEWLGYYLRLVNPFAGTTQFTADLSDGTTRSAPPVSRGRFEALARALGSGPPRDHPVFSDLGKGVGLYTYDSFDASPGALKAMDGVFAQVVQAGTTDLILDLRTNGGGSTDAGEALLGHMTTQPYRQFRSTVVRWSTEALARAGGGTLFFPFSAGTWTRFESDPETPTPREPRVRVKLHLLVGPGTFSSASDFAATVLDYQLGDLWGYETGGVRTCAGDVITVQLPRTGWPLGVSHKVFFGPRPVVGESRHGALPQHPATPEALAPYEDAPDPLLAWVTASLRP